jgi:biopolymer transport protein ExbB/TolQ
MWGLIIAVPAYFCYALLQQKIFFYERKVLPKIAEKLMKHLSKYL